MAALAEEGNDGDTRVTSDDSDVLVLGVGLLDLGDEAAGTDNVKGGDTEELLGVVDALLLENLGADGNGRVDRVGNDQQLSLGSRLGDSLGKITDDGGIGVEEIITGHAGLSGHTSGDENDVGALEALSQAAGGGVITGDGRLGVDVRDISSDT